MKTKIVIGFSAFSLCLFVIGMLTGFKYAEPKQTEGYASIVVKEWNNDLVDIITTIEDQPTTIETIKFPKPAHNGLNTINYGVIFKKLHELNAKGFELVNTTESHAGNMSSSSYCYMFKRKIN